MNRGDSANRGMVLNPRDFGVLASCFKHQNEKNSAAHESIAQWYDKLW